MTLPMPLTLRLPGPEWRAVPPESVGVSNAELLVARSGGHPDYAPTITVSGGWRNDAATLETIAEESVLKLRAEAEDVELVRRREVGSPEAPGVVQEIGVTVPMDGKRIDVRQVQAIFELRDQDGGGRAVMLHTLNCHYRDLGRVLPEFETYLRSLEVGGSQETEPAPS